MYIDKGIRHMLRVQELDAMVATDVGSRKVQSTKYRALRIHFP